MTTKESFGNTTPVKGGKYPGGETMDRVISVMCCDNVNRGVNYHPNGTIVLHATILQLSH